MSFDGKLAGIFGMTDEVWARHANPWSVWTRFTGLPLAILAVWSRVWLGWSALVAFLLVAVWIWLNPRIFPKPGSTGNWASKAVLGERVWLNRKAVPIPEHHRKAINILNIITGCGLPFCIWGLVALSFWPTVFGMIVVIFGKMWFLDRMVWLYDEMKDAHPDYRRWLY